MANIIDEVASMTLAEKLDLARALRAAIADELAASAGGAPERCPRCGCPSFVRKGRDASGSQRWLCRGCARTFGARTMGLLGRSKLPAGKWMEFAACMADALPLRETAARIGVSLYTAWYMRMRVCQVMSSKLLAPRGDVFEVDGTYLPDSLPGNHARSRWHSLGRDPHRSGHDRPGRGKKGLVSVICGVSELGDCFCQLADRAEDQVSASLCIDMLPEGCVVATDGWRGYSAGFVLGGRTHEVRDGRRLPSVNALHSRLKAFVAGFRGLSVRRLQRYLDWFCWIEQHRRHGGDRRELLYMHEASGTYPCVRRIIHLEDWPFMGCWNRNAIGRRYGYMSMMV